MVLICNSPDKADQILAGLAADVIAPESIARIASLVPQQLATSWNDLQEDVRYRSARRTVEQLLA
jgi:beta-N-acetylhexosaminidase